jgi:hypothetical protein
MDEARSRGPLLTSALDEADRIVRLTLDGRPAEDDGDGTLVVSDGSARALQCAAAIRLTAHS